MKIFGLNREDEKLPQEFDCLEYQHFQIRLNKVLGALRMLIFQAVGLQSD